MITLNLIFSVVALAVSLYSVFVLAKRPRTAAQAPDLKFRKDRRCATCSQRVDDMAAEINSDIALVNGPTLPITFYICQECQRGA